MAMSVAPQGGRTRIMIYGPKSDGTYHMSELGGTKWGQGKGPSVSFNSEDQ
jgi:hypothetical protein